LTRFRELCDWVRQDLRVTDVILDGEVVALDAEGRQDFRGLLSRRGNLHYAAFDVLWLTGKDLRGLPLSRRRRALERLIPATSTVLSRLFAVEGRGRDLFAAAQRLDLDGTMAKRKADPYAEALWAASSEGSAWFSGESPELTMPGSRGSSSAPAIV
jgi:bifunctional non-homologous end joining protein LigD